MDDDVASLNNLNKSRALLLSGGLSFNAERSHLLHLSLLNDIVYKLSDSEFILQKRRVAAGEVQQQLVSPNSLIPVSYTHLTLPTKRIV